MAVNSEVKFMWFVGLLFLLLALFIARGGIIFLGWSLFPLMIAIGLVVLAALIYLHYRKDVLRIKKERK